LKSIKSVAVVDDDDDAALTIIHALEDAGFLPFRQPAGGTVHELAMIIKANSEAAICDHRLRYGGFADISGAELAATLIELRHPTILATQYLDQYADIAIRSFRSNLPVVMRREVADEPDELRSAFARCKVELRRGKIKERKLMRTLLSVQDVTDVGNVKVVDAIVHGWSPRDTVRFPLDLVAEPDRADVNHGAFLTALTNFSTELKVDLYFEDVRLAPPADTEDELG